jgi:hypothetical protein
MIEMDAVVTPTKASGVVVGSNWSRRWPATVDGQKDGMRGQIRCSGGMDWVAGGGWMHSTLTCCSVGGCGAPLDAILGVGEKRSRSRKSAGVLVPSHGRFALLMTAV